MTYRTPFEKMTFWKLVYLKAKREHKHETEVYNELMEKRGGTILNEMEEGDFVSMIKELWDEHIRDLEEF